MSKESRAAARDERNWKNVNRQLRILARAAQKERGQQAKKGK